MTRCSSAGARTRYSRTRCRADSIVVLSLKRSGTAWRCHRRADGWACRPCRQIFVRRIRVGHEQNLALPHVAKRDLPALFKALDRLGLATPTSTWSPDIIACPGFGLLLAGQWRSIPIAAGADGRFANTTPPA